MERRRLIIEHDVVGAGNAHDVVDARRAEQRQQDVHIVLIGFGVVRVADVAAHRQAEQLAAEMVLKPGADDLLAVVEIFGPDEADDRVHQQRLELARDGIGAGFERLLIDAVMRVRRQRRALPRLEVHAVVADRAALERRARRRGLPSECASVTPKDEFAASVPPIDWKTRSTGAPLPIASIVVVTWVSTQLCVGIS